MHACFIVLQLRSDSCQIHGYVMLCLPPVCFSCGTVVDIFCRTLISETRQRWSLELLWICGIDASCTSRS